MIYESSFWKNDLLKQAKSLRSKTSQKRWSKKSLARLEQLIMLGFYSIRKLIEARKLSDSITNIIVTTKAYAWKGKTVTMLNWHDLNKLYNLDKEESRAKDLGFFCNQFIHSYIFLFSFKNDCLDGLFINSDRERNKIVYFLQINQLIDIFEQVGTNYSSSSFWSFDEKQNDYRISSY